MGLRFNSNSGFAIRSQNSQGRLEGDGSNGTDRPFDSRWSLRMTILVGLSFAIRKCTGSDAEGLPGLVLGLATAHRQECLCHLRRAAGQGFSL